MKMIMNQSEIINFLGEEHENYFNSIAPPIIQTSNFCFPTVKKMRHAIQNEFLEHVYTRGNNPTVEILRQKLAALEKTEDCLVTSSGCAAITAAVMSNLKTGDHVICIDKPYSWVNHLLTKILTKYNIETSFVDCTKIENIEKVIKPNTRLFYLESPNSWTYELIDYKNVSVLAKQNNIVTIADNSYCTPLYQNPAELGIDIVVHSASKYLSGHSDVVAGAICGSREMIKKIFDNEFMTFGGIISPFDAWLMLRGLRTLPLRLEKSSHSAKNIIEFLTRRSEVEGIYYPFHTSNTQINLAKIQMKNSSGLFTIKLKTDSRDKIELFCESLEYFRIAVSWGGHESLVFPAVAAYDPAKEQNPKLSWNMVRFYIGLEDENILKEDLLQALQKSNI
jgi:cystathionine beta-lyase/cystathionine gamma-synthase